MHISAACRLAVSKASDLALLVGYVALEDFTQKKKNFTEEIAERTTYSFSNALGIWL